MTHLPSGIAALFTPQTTSKVNRPILSVSQLVNQIKQTLETTYFQVVVMGEISSFKPWRSGHWYFDLKDEQALIPCVMFKAQNGLVRFEVKEGMKAVITGRVSVYPLQSRVQLIVDTIEPHGKGALALAFEQLKQKLEGEGLFLEAHKVPLPHLPMTVGVVTSPQGAALQDIIRVLRQRMPHISILVSPCRVQGTGAAAEIVQALSRLDKSGFCDVIILGRGGGSLEDLWAFNEEPLARAVFECKTPLISAVGHETDFTIVDFVADARAATPTHAAQMVVPEFQEVVRTLGYYEQRLHKQIKGLFSKLRLAIEQKSKRLKHPQALLLQWRQRIDQLSMRLHNNIRQTLNQSRQRLSLRKGNLSGLSPLSVLSRGYAAIYLKNSTGSLKLVSAIKEVALQDTLSIQMQDGLMEVQVLIKRPKDD